jgi:fructose-bisphosphate aldolase, class I
MTTTTPVERTLGAVAAALVSPGKGILAADESNGTMNARLEAAGVAASVESRLNFRELLLTAPGIERQVSGVILYDETFRQRDSEGTPFPELLARRGMLAGIKVDTGAKPLAEADGETITEGLDALRDRLHEYRDLGAEFAKWRAVIRIAGELPSDYCISANAHALGRYAALCQEAGIVPIVEPEVLMDGGHTIDRAEQVTSAALGAVFAELRNQRVELEAIVLKPNMVLAGSECRLQPTVDEVARRTLTTLRQTVPAAVPGIAFLSGGQSNELAAAHLNALNLLGNAPWQLTFSYGRALIADALMIWGGSERNRRAAQLALVHRAHCNATARAGRYNPAMEIDPELAEEIAVKVAEAAPCDTWHLRTAPVTVPA